MKRISREEKTKGGGKKQRDKRWESVSTSGNNFRGKRKNKESTMANGRKERLIRKSAKAVKRPELWASEGPPGGMVSQSGEGGNGVTQIQSMGEKFQKFGKQPKY